MSESLSVSKVANNAGQFMIYDDNGKTVAVTYDDDNGKTAELFAAAPAMLESLRDCITDDNANCIVTNDIAYMIRRFKAINAIARAAIAKATN